MHCWTASLAQINSSFLLELTMSRTKMKQGGGYLALGLLKTYSIVEFFSYISGAMRSWSIFSF